MGEHDRDDSQATLPADHEAPAPPAAAASAAAAASRTGGADAGARAGGVRPPGRLDRLWMARAGSHAALRWNVRMARTRNWNFWAGIALLSVFMLGPAAVLVAAGLEDGQLLDREQPGLVEWVLNSWSLILAVLVAGGLLLARRVHLFDLGFTGWRTLPNAVTAPAPAGDPAVRRLAASRGLPRDVGFTLLAALALAVGYAGLGVVLWLVEPGYIDGVLIGSGWPLILVVSLVVVAPLGEEVVFRSLLYPIFRREYGPAFGALLNALVFAIVHAAFTGHLAPENLNHFFGGLIFCFAYERTGSLWPAMLLHLLGNGSLVLLHLLPLEGVSLWLHGLMG